MTERLNLGTIIKYKTLLHLSNYSFYLSVLYPRDIGKHKQIKTVRKRKLSKDC